MPESKCTCRWYGVTIPGEPQMGTMYEAEPDPYCIEHFPPRWKLACINWTSPDPVPHATTYLLIAGEAYVTRYWPTWADAVEWLNDQADNLDWWARTLQNAQRTIANEGA